MVMKLDEKGYPEVRALTLGDRETFTQLLKDFVNKSDNKQLRGLASQASIGNNKAAKDSKEGSKGDDDGVITEELYGVLKSVIEGVLAWVKEDVTRWFMDLVGAETREQYINLPFDTEVHIIKQLLAQESFKNFFSNALGVFNTVQGYVNK